MDRIRFREEAEDCRRQAISYAGKPEAPFLLRIAEAFENLQVEQRPFEVREHDRGYSDG